MKRRIWTLVLSVGLLLGVLSVEAGAARNITAARTYTGQFTDITETDWYYDAVTSLYELGLTEGKGDIFDPEGSITVGEVVTMAARLRSLTETGDSEAGPAAYSEEGGAWYVRYISYLQSEGVLGDELSEYYTRPATRGEAAHVLSLALAEQVTPMNGELVDEAWASGQYIRDVTEETRYREDILRLYAWGVTAGLDERGSFRPESGITRGEAAAMVARLAYGEQRVRLEWEVLPAYSKKGTTLADLIYSDGTFYEDPAPDEGEKIDADVRYMLSRGERTLRLQYPSGVLNRVYADELMQSFLNAARNYVEQTYNSVHLTYTSRTGVLTMGSSLYPEGEVERYREATMEYAIAVHDQMWESGEVGEDMTEYDKAKAYYRWICENCRYDHTGAGMSHTGYRLFAEQVAVCDGYTAAYNLLLKLEGIECGTYSTADHIWTVAHLDGKSCHIDTTWGDQPYGVEYRYFDMTETEAASRFK